MTVGKRIKEARLKKGWSQAELASLMGYKSRSSINKIETDGRDIPRSQIIKFATVLDVSPMTLMGWDNLIQDEKTAPPETLGEAADEMNAIIEKLSLLSDEELDLLEQYVDKLLASRDE